MLYRHRAADFAPHAQSFLLALLGVGLILAASGPRLASARSPRTNPADEYPTRTVTIVCPWSPGGGTDRVSRYWAESLQQAFGQPARFVVVNRTGGAGAIGHFAGAHAPADGHTIAMITFELSTMHRMKISTLTYRDYECLMQVNADPAAIVVRQDAPWRNLAEWLDAIRESPGSIKMSGTATGGAWDLARAGLLRAAGIPIDSCVWVPHPGAAPSVMELRGGHIDAVCCSVPEVALQLAAGDVRILAVMSEERMAEFPELPTAREEGVDWVAVGWRGLALPKGTPPEIVARLRSECLRIAGSEDYRQFMEKNGFGVKIRATGEFTQFLEAQDAQWRDVVEAAGYDKGLSAKGDPGPRALSYTMAFVVLCGTCVMAIGKRRRPGLARDSDVTPSCDGPSTAEHSVPMPSVWSRQVLVTMFAMAGYVAFIPWFGFTVSTVVFVTWTTRRLGARWAGALVSAAIMIALIHVLFAIVFEVQLPSGLLWQRLG